MSSKHRVAKKLRQHAEYYSEFDQINGEHPWMDAVSEGFVSYRVRELGTGKVAYFNFILAKEMGLISADHPHEMTPELEQKLIQTFSIQIINEYDELNARRIDPSTIKPHRYMATRYLQLQHSNRQGKTSGDGRGIWNGVFSNNGKTWDVSSRGTGVTCLSPGSVSAQKPLRTGNTDFGYGCGLAEIDELLGASILAEAMHLQGLQTERVLCVVDLGKGYGIGVRAALNLIRPAHLFLYLKQERLDLLKSATDYFIDRQRINKKWTIQNGPHKYDQFLEHISRSFAEFVARLEVDYIFAWLDWDGDNVLADAGIIDYGSVRQFGLRHDKYRYDDVERFSTNLNEQKQKGRLIVQVFAQLVDYLKTGSKKPLKEFQKHPEVEKFNANFESYRVDRLLYNVGFTKNQRKTLKQNPEALEQFDRIYSYFEKAKVSGKIEKVADGVNLPALFNMRVLLKDFPTFLAVNPLPFAKRSITEQAFFKHILSGYAKRRDAKLGEKTKRKIREFQNAYMHLVDLACDGKGHDRTLREMSERSQRINSDKRITGNALIELVDEILQQKKKGLPLQQIQNIIDRLVFDYRELPEVSSSKHYAEIPSKPLVKMDLLAKLLNLVETNSESI
ncbi:hypothetical protein BDW_13025 [Bdellovibrio bacteriovorus W]|nr:hypothetical protein BDW_13025 [Bdellovibrio bacteriovorus W]